MKELEQDKIFSLQLTIANIEIWTGPFKNVEKEWMEQKNSDELEDQKAVCGKPFQPIDPTYENQEGNKDDDEEEEMKNVESPPLDDKTLEAINKTEEIEVEQPDKKIKRNNPQNNIPFRIKISFFNFGDHILDQVNYESYQEKHEESQEDSESECSEDETISEEVPEEIIQEDIGSVELSDEDKTQSAKTSSKPMSTKQSGNKTESKMEEENNEGPVDPKKLTAALQALKQSQEEKDKQTKEEKERAKQAAKERKAAEGKENQEKVEDAVDTNIDESEKQKDEEELISPYCCCCGLETKKDLPKAPEEPEPIPAEEIPAWEKLQSHPLADEGWKNFNRGVFFCFVATPSRLIQSIQAYSIRLVLSRYNGADPQVLVGVARLRPKEFGRGILAAAESRDPQPTEITVRDQFLIKNTDEEIVGQVDAQIVLKYFNTTFVPSYFVRDEDTWFKDSLYKDTEEPRQILLEKNPFRTVNLHTIGKEQVKEAQYSRFFKQTPKTANKNVLFNII